MLEKEKNQHKGCLTEDIVKKKKANAVTSSIMCNHKYSRGRWDWKEYATIHRRKYVEEDRIKNST